MLIGALTLLAAGADADLGLRPMVLEPFRVVIDAGHGGRSPGCTAVDGQTFEKDVALALATDVANALRVQLPHAEVEFTREDDDTLTLTQRIAYANAVGADLFLSLHANASPSHTQAGFETFVLDGSLSEDDAAWLAIRTRDDENDVPGQMLAEFEADIHRQLASTVAQMIQDEQVKRFPTRPNRGVRQAPFDVLMGASMPAVLVEAGFLDHPDDAPLLMQPASRQTIAEGIAAAVVRFYRWQRP